MPVAHESPAATPALLPDPVRRNDGIPSPDHGSQPASGLFYAVHSRKSDKNFGFCSDHLLRSLRSLR